MKNILVLSDFSKCANNAIRYALKMADAYGNKLVFYHATYQYFLNEMPEQAILNLKVDAEKEHLALLKTSVQKIQKSLKIEKINARYITHYGASLTDNLEAIIKAEKIDLIIMGTKGTSGIERILFGSNTAKVIDTVSCPVISVPEKKSFKPFKKILLFSNFSDINTELKDILPFAKKFDCLLEICHLDENKPVPTEGIEELIEVIKQKNTFKKIKLTTVKREFTINLVSQIEKISAASKPDLISVHTLKYNWLERLLTYSYSKELLYHSKTAMLTFKKE